MLNMQKVFVIFTMTIINIFISLTVDRFIVIKSFYELVNLTALGIDPYSGREQIDKKYIIGD